MFQAWVRAGAESEAKLGSSSSSVHQTFRTRAYPGDVLDTASAACPFRPPSCRVALDRYGGWRWGSICTVLTNWLIDWCHGSLSGGEVRSATNLAINSIPGPCDPWLTKDRQVLTIKLRLTRMAIFIEKKTMMAMAITTVWLCDDRTRLRRQLYGRIRAPN